MKVLSELFRKVVDFEDVYKKSEVSKASWYDVDEIITLSDSEFEYFINNLLDDYDFLKREGEYSFIIQSDNYEPIYVNTQGYSYARYVGVVLGAKE